MPRYIDAEAIPDLFNEKFKETQKLIEAGENQLDSLAEGFTEAEKIVLFKALTANVHEVVYTKFELVNNGKGVCSNCHRLDSINKFAKYCRYCGAFIKWEDDSNG